MMLVLQMTATQLTVIIVLFKDAKMDRAILSIFLTTLSKVLFFYLFTDYLFPNDRILIQNPT